VTAKPVVPRARAQADVELAVDYYTQEAGADVAFDFIDALEQTYALIGETPGAGSPRWSHELNLPGLRSVQLKGFPWLVFYLEFDSHVDIWRVLHAKRDMPAWMSDTDGN
jgi:toxin ParE1/3/4